MTAHRAGRVSPWSLAVALAVAAAPARAVDHSNLEEGLPVEVEDAYPIGFRGRELQLMTRYERTDDEKDRFRVEPRVELGVYRNAQVRLLAPFFFGDAEKTGSGDLGVELFYNFNQDRLLLPALAAAVETTFPTGKDRDGVELAVKGIVTKTIPGTSRFQRVHANVSWTANTDAGPEVREGRWRGVLGYQVRITSDWMLVADVFREEERDEGKESNVAELGFRVPLTPLVVFSAGVGAGFLDESPPFRVTAALQYESGL
jgi:hypothetical protein